ncbi:MAG: PEP-CTERM-box response regulator transcription factor [Hydrogenophilales bacterium CG17_big_fil_post_rev_8_21_14_2_50_63_12]|nr:MAG: PEP-CTERM-box response regulator transcription factor [Hydrogenophilales bacterium CG17_big_fil_post_rev_8_21_14_2_50_63_12]PIX97001.1 MAG: PEP-CTERM-box response regulator transcription factor [Hydrogenophilales bacterium CG_4_10_14_3_um_filter_63_21]PJB02305.1 MAG: PEP-CTERM-box response regulator transcription factor [Hydrogenophilales bacterium CG_4_9_14_3_um_filter_63_34]
MSDKPARILLVEDDVGLQKQIKWSLDDYEVLVAADREAALAQIRRFEPGVVLLDLGLPPDPDGATEGLAALPQILQLCPTTKIIVVTGNQDRANAVKAISLGAFDFYNKPFDEQILKIVIARAFHVFTLEQENRQLTGRARPEPLQGLLTGDPAMLKVCRTIEKVAPSNASVLLLGESGTGKEVLARGLHELSPRVKERFVAINCAAIPENLLESELFGYEKGAFTGAAKQTLGKIEYAHHGTLFLDEIGDLPMPLQAKLLRFLQERVIERLGARGEIPVDVRVVAATHQNLEALIKDGRFREDLFYRLSEIAVRIPPLCERLGDLSLLAHAFLERFAQSQGRALRGFSPEAIQAIESHAWPGNVRELENTIKRAVIMSDGPHISQEDLGLATALEQENEPLNLRQVRDEAERSAVLKAIGRSNGSVAHAAEMLGISRPTLYDLMNRLGLK